MYIHFHIIVFMLAFALLLVVCDVYRSFVFKLSTHLVCCSLCAHLHIIIFKSTIVLQLVVCFVYCSFVFRSLCIWFDGCCALIFTMSFQFSYQLFVAIASICQCNGHRQWTCSWFLVLLILLLQSLCFHIELPASFSSFMLNVGWFVSQDHM